MKAIETSYKGYKFRSRTEARWGVFFDAVGVKWEYEVEGYDLGDAGWYLPDFWLPDAEGGRGTYVEIKGTIPTDHEQNLAGALAYSTGKTVIILAGRPYPGEFTIGIFDGYDYENNRPPFGRRIVIDTAESIKMEAEFAEWHERSPRSAFAIAYSALAYRIVPKQSLTDNFVKRYFIAACSARFEHGEAAA